MSASKMPRRPTPLVPIRTTDELKKILFIQMSVTQQAKNEMIAVATEPDIAAHPEKFFVVQRVLLEKYAKYPTLTEFAADPRLTNMYKWGATFGVAALIGGLILEEVRRLRPHFETVLRQMYIVLLKELDKPTHQYLIEPLEKALNVKVEPTAGSGATQDQADVFIRQVIHDLIESYVLVSTQYGLMNSDGKNVTLTPVGRRVFLHLADTQRFIDEMTEAHKKFQAIKPKLSMA